mmetsp:Transcript_23207/g.41047  ORF Transcript_23207/g.41047 Transcript_23207/m.41047 type:complete len:237 (-) Transcript_23207:420-1130(-)
MPNLDLVCFYCMEAFHVVLQSTFMYKDHKFCSEKCRSGQIKLDMKLENVQDQIGTSNCVKKLEATNVNLSKNGKFFSAEITSHDGTEYMRQIGVKSVLLQLEKAVRSQLVNNIVAGYIRWEPVGQHLSPRDDTKPVQWTTEPCLMCFKTSRALEVVLCDEAAYIPEKCTSVELLPLLELRKKQEFSPKSNLRMQLAYDKRASRYLRHENSRNSRNNKNPTHSGRGEIGTCQLCTIM